MITFVLAAAALVAALFVAVALDGATTEAPPGVVAALVAARLLATDQSVPVAWDVRLGTDRERTRRHDRPASQQRLGPGKCPLFFSRGWPGSDWNGRHQLGSLATIKS